MKFLKLVALLVVLSCSTSKKNKDWDSGGASQRAFNEQRAVETDQTTREQVPDLVPATKPKTSK